MFRRATLFCCLLLISWPKTSSKSEENKVNKILFGVLKKSLLSAIDPGKIIKEFFDKGESSISDGERKAITQLTELAENVLTVKDELLHRISDTLVTRLSSNLNKLFDIFLDIAFNLKTYLRLYESIETRTVTEISDFAQSIISYGHGFKRKLFKMHEILLAGDDKLESTLSIIKKASSERSIMCSRKETPQLLISNLYNLVVEAHENGLEIRKFCYTFMQQYKNESYEQIINDDLTEFQKAVSKTYEAVKDAMKDAPRNLYRCDPDKWILGKNYEQLHRVLQRHVVDCADIMFDRGYCDASKIYKHTYQSSHSRHLEVVKRCEEGHVRDCQKFNSEYDVCYSENSSPRLYDWAKPSEDDIYGYKNITNCSNMTATENINGFMKSVFGHTFCLCTCDSGSRVDLRYFSLLPVRSDVANNKVVTGVQLVKLGRAFYIKIKQGQIGLNGTITGESEWQEVPNFRLKRQWLDITRASNFTRTERTHLSRNNDDVSMTYEHNTVFIKNKFFFPVTYDWSKVKLDELNVNVRKNEVITGLKFAHNSDALALEILGTPYDHETGTLNLEDSTWRGTILFEEVTRQEILLNQPDVPSSSNPNAEFQISDTNQFVRFTKTDDHKDLGQNTVPFIDTQPITTDPPMPLIGAGLILKRKGFSGGFLALQLKHYDLTKGL